MTAPLIYDVTEQEFDAQVLGHSRQQPVLVDFWAEWCPPCRALTPVLERVARAAAGEFVLAKVDADENMRLAGRYGLRGFPTVILFVDGVEVGRFSSMRTESYVREFLDAHLPPERLGRPA